MYKFVLDVDFLGDLRLRFLFFGHERRDINIAELTSLDGVFEALRDRKFFEQVRVNPEIGTIVWPNGADFCPDVLYERSQPVRCTGPGTDSIRIVGPAKP